MALVLKDRVKETSTTAGTGTITLNGAVAGFQSFSAVGNANTTYYAIVDPTTGDWEVGLGTYTASGTTLSRDTVLSSSNSGLLVSFVANPKDVFVTYPSEKSVYEDASNVVNATSFGAITATSAALNTGTVSTTPASNTDIANKQYVDTLVSSGITYHTPVKYEVPDTTGNLNATYNNGASGVGATLTNAGALVAFTPDGTVASSGDRIIVYNQTNQFENGVYTVTTVGSGSVAWVLTRATDADTYALKSPNGLGSGDAFFITSGATGAGETYVCNTAGVITFGTTAITFAQISDSTLYTAGTGLTLSGTQFSITNTAVTAATYGSASAVPVFAVNAQGQITGVTDTNIAINGSAVSGNISGSAGSVANALTLGTYLTGTSYNGSSAVTATVDATSANTASKVVARDASGNFSAGTITATLNGTATSTASATNLSGGAANQVVYQSAAGTTAFATAPSASNQVLNWNGSAFTWSAGTISGVPLGSNLNSLTAGTYLSGTAYNGSAAQTWSVNATSANTASTVVARDGSGNFSAGTITASLSGNATTATSATSASTSTTQGKTDASTNIATTAFSKWMFATSSTGGTLDWNNSSNTIPGVGTTLLLGTATNGPGGGNYYHPFNIEYSGINGTGNVTQMAIAYGSPGNELYMRGSYSGGWSSWVRFLNSSNYNSYAPTLTGGGASGTWNISITGSAGSVPTTSVTNLYSPNGASVVSGDASTALPSVGNSLIHTLATGPGGNDGHILGMSWANTTSSYGAQIWVDTDPTNRMSVRSRSSGGAWNSWADVITSWSDDQTKTGYFQSNSSLRAPIFYDSNDTAYYVNPNSVSNLYNLTVGNWGTPQSYPGILIVGNTGYNYNFLNGSWSGSVTAGILANCADQWEFAIHDSGERVVSPFIFYGGAGSNYILMGRDIGWGTTYIQAASSFRAPIFYDSDDTGYYLNPNGSSLLYGIVLSGNMYFRPNSWIQMDGSYGMYWPNHYGAHFYPNAGSTYTQLQIDGSKNSYSGMYISHSAVNGMMYDGSGNGGVYREANGRWYFYYAPSADCMGIGTSATSSSYSLYLTKGVFAQSRIDATIYYDTNNTAYYVDPASTSNLNQVNLQGFLRRNTSAAGYLEGNYPTSVDGNSSSCIYTIGGAYQPGTTSLGNMYGIGYTVGNGTANPGLGATGWGLYVASGGTSRFFFDSDSGNGFASGSFRATAFYYSGNTAYGFIGTQVFADTVDSGIAGDQLELNYSRGTFVSISHDSMRAPLFYDYNNTSYYVDPAGTSQLSYVLANDWFRPQGGSGVYWQDYGRGIRAADSEFSYGNIGTYGSGLNGYRGYGIWPNNLVLMSNGSSWGFYSPSGGIWTMLADMSGNVTFNGNVTAYSDLRLKDNVREIDNVIDRRNTLAMSAIKYERDGRTRIGYGAQTLRDNGCAEFVMEADDALKLATGLGTLSVDYGETAAILAVTSKMTDDRVSALEAQVQQLLEIINELRNS